MESLAKKFEEGEKEMYVSAFEKVYTKKGREEERRDVIHNMMAEGLSIDNIAKYTRLPQEEVEKLLN
jgi:predicted transposase YdaD